MREQLRHYIREHMEKYKYLVNDLYEHLEIGNQELRSIRVSYKMLRKEGFEVTEEHVIPTGFLGVWNSGKPGPVIVYMCEYDALPEIGHDCGHNLIAGMSLATGCTLKSILSSIGGEVRIIDTPAGESLGGKVSMAITHVFDNVNAALILHPDTENSLRGRTLAIYPLHFEFFGQSAHTCTPQNGKGALDAVVMSYMSVDLLRQFAEPSAFIHEVIAYGGETANAIPAYANLKYYSREETMECVKELCEKAEVCVEGACTMSGCTSHITTYEYPYDDCVINYTLTDMLKDEYEDFGYTWEGVDEAAQGSSDVGSVSYCCPALQGYIKIADSCVNRHSREMATATIPQQGSRTLFDGVLALTDIGRHLIMEPDTMEKVWKELKANRK